MMKALLFLTNVMKPADTRSCTIPYESIFISDQISDNAVPGFPHNACVFLLCSCNPRFLTEHNQPETGKHCTLCVGCCLNSIAC